MTMRRCGEDRDRPRLVIGLEDPRRLEPRYIGQPDIHDDQVRVVLAGQIEALEVRPVGEDRVIALFQMFVTGKGSGIELSRHDAMVYTLRAGKVAKIVYYNDQQQALEAVGLQE